MKYNNFTFTSIKDLPDDCEVGLLFMHPSDSYSIWRKFKLRKGSPLRELLEAQESFEGKYAEFGQGDV